MIEVMAASAADGLLFDVQASDAVPCVQTANRGRRDKIGELPFNWVHGLTFHSVSIPRIPWGGLLLIRTSLPIGLVGLHEASCSLSSKSVHHKF